MNIENIICDNKNTIFNSITEFDDEVINLCIDDDDDNNNNDEIPLVVSIPQLLENYINRHNHFHLSIITLLKIILSYKKKDNTILFDDYNNVNLFLQRRFLPKHSKTNTISII